MGLNFEIFEKMVQTFHTSFKDIINSLNIHCIYKFVWSYYLYPLNEKQFNINFLMPNK